MDSKDYRNLLVREIREMSLLCESLTEVEEIPSGLLLLSKAKVESMVAIIDMLSKESEKKSEEQIDDYQRVETVEDAKDFEDTKEENFVEEETVSTLGEDVVEDQEVKETVAEEPKEKLEDSNLTTKKNVASERRFLKPLKISIGDRFLYIKLFNNDANEMNKAVAEINKLNTYEEALDYLSQYQWDEENEGVNEFYKLLKAHFS